MKFSVEKSFFEKIPDALFGIIIVNGFDNTLKYPLINELFNKSINESLEKLQRIKVKELDTIIPYRDAFRSLDINPNKYMCSIEALTTRISKGNSIPSINPIVDLGNALSLKYMIPIGIHDIDNFIDGTIEIRKSKDGDTFIPFGSNEVEYIDEGEYVYASQNEIKTRRWTWWQGVNSKVTKESKNFFIPIDGFTSNKENILKLQEELVSIMNTLGYNAKTYLVSKDNPTIEY